MKTPAMAASVADHAWTVEPARFRSRARNTPFAGVTGTGAPVLTIVGGKAVTT